jgi:hypothetical protein
MDTRGGGAFWLIMMGCAPWGHDAPTPASNVSSTPDAAVAEPMALAAPAATPPPPVGVAACGTLLTGSVRLTADVGPCAGDGITFGDHDLTLDCDGHAILGTGTGRGVVVPNKVRDTVKNCRIEGFSTSVETSGATATRFLDNVFVGLGIPLTGCVSVFEGLGERYARNEFHDCWTAMFLRDSSNLDVEHNLFQGGADGMNLVGVNEGHRVRRNEAVDVGRDPVGGTAFLLVGAARGNRFDENHIRGGGYGFQTYGADAEGNRLERNHVEGVLRSGFQLWAEDNLIRYNTVEGAAEDGFRVLAASNVLDHNEAWDNGGNGIALAAAATHTLVDHSRACGNGGYDRYDDVGSSTNAWIDSDFCTQGGF